LTSSRAAQSERYYCDAVVAKEPCHSEPANIRKMVEALPRLVGKHEFLHDPVAKARNERDEARRADHLADHP